jgi:hypothetical protein
VKQFVSYMGIQESTTFLLIGLYLSQVNGNRREMLIQLNGSVGG